MNVFKAVKDFHEKFKVNINVPFTEEEVDFRLTLLHEEYEELFEEFYEDALSSFPNPNSLDRQNITKELADIIYVTVGMAVTFGLPLEEVFKRTHESNMTKTGDKREDGKILKGEDYVPPALGDLFDE